jgi:ferredoxin-NADP reductase
MAGAAVLGRLNWKVGTVVALRDETVTARTIALQVPEWPGHVAGQRVDLRVTAADGYSAVREYSIASAPRADGRIELSVERLPDGEVSPYLTQDLAIGDVVELRGPIGGWFVWREDQTEPIQLVAGGSGIVPLMAMIRSRMATRSAAPFRLPHSVRNLASVWYRDELHALSADGIGVTFVYTCLSAQLATTARPYRRDRPRGGHVAIDLVADLLRVWPNVVCRARGRAPHHLRTPSRPDQNRAFWPHRHEKRTRAPVGSPPALR